MTRRAAVAEKPLLTARGLSIHAGWGNNSRTIVSSLSLELGAERVALVGESGSGKSLTARALTGLLRPPLAVTAERLELEGLDLRRLSARQWSQVRGVRMALVLQDPRHALNPVLTVGRQLDEMLRLHGRVGAAERRRRIHDMLEAVGLSDGNVLRAYPQELSGGMGQRIMLAMMLLHCPRVLIADEPTSALDADLRERALELMTRLVTERGMGMLLISHDLQQVARYCDRVLIMWRGRIVEELHASDLTRATHPYTRALWSCRPSGATHGTQLPVWEEAVE
jgi:peptide/nickel transport system ATP-binding protein